MQIFTIGFTGHSAREFFSRIRDNQIATLIDVRLYNSTQLAGFSKGRDLEFFLRELCDCDYIHALPFAPSKSLFTGYKNGQIDWAAYQVIYDNQINTLDSLAFFRQFAGQRICLLCAEHTPEKCHRRLLAEKIAETFADVSVEHL
ncbi:MAG: DUF488 domain-containing protein [Oscillospiraceae bacterium]|jgi:uncharacterized protein (DUF488 family)|nr:DUF488 domain-containing protein [Oscillospiraceae bacterium]